MPNPEKTLTIPKKVKLILEFDYETGKFTMNGPVNNQFACYGLLGMAHESISKANSGAPQISTPVPGQPAPSNLLKKH